ncbi:adenylyl-sulfate kinase [Paenibacillus psychroresistens]|uniref:Adenylyl-sulfate kinase n=1 Tax=Paenibacillus psychroresistens TaxID=1778678 RepID=A0A6B8RSP1_9BACL|nr:adenylyl-sulfate kinase [Paenibacillus psychroresistens]QGQ98762.1 adenylyl-sulfate kinase [Paenibacillus psychroresistens]
MSESKITWCPSIIVRDDRYRLNNHKSCVLWLTGLSGSGKSTLAFEIEKELYNLNCHAYVLDGDNIRHGLNNDLGFSPDERKENIRRIAEVANLFVDAGIVAVTAFISPYRADRDMARSIFHKGDFIEIYVKCSLSECERRDPKGLYKKARVGEILEFTGISAPYEPPVLQEITIESERLTVSESVTQILDFLIFHNYLYKV